MPAAANSANNSAPSSLVMESNNSADSRMELKRKIAEKEDEAKRILEEYEQKLAEAKRLREELEKKSVVDEMDET